jgi:hypothetical protein
VLLEKLLAILQPMLKPIVMAIYFWTFSIVSMFLNHYVYRDGSSLET